MAWGRLLEAATPGRVNERLTDEPGQVYCVPVRLLDYVFAPLALACDFMKWDWPSR